MHPKPGKSVHPILEFRPAPAGTRVRVATMLALGAVLVAFVVVAVIFAFQPGKSPMGALIALGAGLPLLAAVGYVSRILAYRVLGQTLHVVRPLYTAKISLAGLETVVVDRTALEGARKTIGNDGLGAIAGRFRSAKLGSFRAYVTDGDRAVVLRWPDRCLVVSPENPGSFIDAMRMFAGTSHGRG